MASTRAPWVLLASALLVASSACTSSQPPLRGVPGTTAEDQVQPSSKPFVAIPGTRFAVRMEDALSTEASRVGDPFEAKVLTPVIAQDGGVLVPEGAKVSGRVVGVDRGPSPRLRLVFDRIETGRGEAELAAALASTQKNVAVVPIEDPSLVDPLATGRGIGGGPPAPGPRPLEPEDTYHEPVVVIPEGAILELVLVRPLPPS